MKTIWTRTLCAYSIASILSSSFFSIAEAKSLEDYRRLTQQIPAAKMTVQQLDQLGDLRVKSLRAQMGTTGYVIPNLQGATGIMNQVLKLNTSPRPIASIFFKSLFDKAIVELIQQDQGKGKPMTFDPSKYDTDIADDIKLARKKVILDALNKPMKDSRGNYTRDQYGNIEGSMNKLVQKYYSIVIKGIDQLLTGQAGGVIKPMDPKLKQSLIQQLQAYVSKNDPLVKGGQSINQVIGSIANLEVSDGVISKITFADDAGNKTEMSPTMMLSIRSKEDAYFIEVQQFFIRYMKDQKEIFQRRLTELGQGTTSTITSSLVRKVVSDDQEVAERQQYLENLKFHLDGKADTDVDYMKDRVQIITESLVKAEGTFQGALAVNKQFRKLSDKQVSFLVDLMLQIRGKDIISSDEILTLNAVIYIQDQKMTGRKDNELNLTEKELFSDLNYYHVLNNELYRLEKEITYDTATQKFYQDQIDQIRKGGGK